MHVVSYFGVICIAAKYLFFKTSRKTMSPFVPLIEVTLLFAAHSTISSIVPIEVSARLIKQTQMKY